MALLHFTECRDALLSILENGFLYLHCETEIFVEIVGQVIGVHLEPEANGMICFTEAELDEANDHQDVFGPYAIAVDKEWAIQSGAKKVEYIPKEGAETEEIRQEFRRLVPTEFNVNGTPVIDAVRNSDFGIRSIAMSLLTNPKVAEPWGVNPEYVSALRRWEWSQTDEHMAEKEWRIRNPNGYSGFQRLPKEQQVGELLALMKHPMWPSMSLELPPGSLVFLACPADEVTPLKEALSGTPFDEVEIKST